VPQPGEPAYEAERLAAHELGVTLFNYPLAGDGTGDITRYADAVQRLHESQTQGLPTLVHCAAGAQRTGGVVACYDLLVRGRSVEAVVEDLRRHGWSPRRNAALPTYLNAHMRELAGELVRRGVIPRIPDPLPRLPTEP
jgi:protein-tyrosine phosphatase